MEVGWKVGLRTVHRLVQLSVGAWWCLWDGGVVGVSRDSGVMWRLVGR